MPPATKPIKANHAIFLQYQKKSIFSIPIATTPGVKGTTNNAPCLLEPARKTAFLHKWNLDAKAPTQQIGFVVVNFKLGQ